MFSKLKNLAALKNSTSAIAGNAANILAKFVARRVFVQVLGIQFYSLMLYCLGIQQIAGLGRTDSIQRIFVTNLIMIPSGE